MTRHAAQTAFLNTTDWAGSDAQLVAGDASNRKYLRLTDANGRTAILMDAPPDKGEDVRPFVRIADYLRATGLSAPEVFAADINQGFLLIEDLGDALFADLMAKTPERQELLYRASIDALSHLHRADPLDLPLCDAGWMETMNALIFEWYAPNTLADQRGMFHTAFRPLAQRVQDAPRVVILRDYHAQNLLWLPGRQGVAAVGQLDFQDALLGHPAYDLVSILQDARRDVPPEIEAAMLDHYLSTSNMDRASFLTAYAVLGVQRNLCILGIFARLCKRDAKPQYIDLIPRVWDYVQRDLAHPELAGLAQICSDILPIPTPDYLEELRAECPSSP